MRRTFQIFTVFLAVFMIYGNALAKAYEIATVAWVGWSPLHVAEAMGFWAEQGIAVDVVEYDDPIIILEAAKAGKIDLAMDMVGSLVGKYMDGEPIVALAETNWSHGGDKIIVQKGHRIGEYVGQPLGVFLKLPSCLYFLGQYLQTQQLAVADFRIIEIPSDDLADQFIAGRIPVIVNYDPWAIKAIQEGNGAALADSADFPGCIPECIWGYRRRLAKMPDSDIIKILKGWIRAAEWISDPANQEQYFEILNKVTLRELPAHSESELKTMVENVRIHSRGALLERNRDDGGLYAYFRSLRAFLAANGLLQKDFRVGEIFDNRLIMQALKDGP